MAALVLPTSGVAWLVTVAFSLMLSFLAFEGMEKFV